MSKFAENPVYVKHEELLRNLHALIASGRADSTEADAIRDEMDDTCLALSQEERDRLGGLSADLYMLTDEEIYERRPPELSSDEALRREAERAYRANDWETLLRLMRYGMPWFPPHRVAFFRARQYDKLRHLATATLFYKKAVEVAPDYAPYQVVLLSALERLGDNGPAVDQAKQMLESTIHPIVVIFAAGVLQRYAPPQELKQTSRDLIPKLETAVDELKSGDVVAAVPSVFTYAVAILASCHRNIGDLPKAIAVWSEAVQINDEPDKWLDHVALGQLKLEAGDANGAAKEFENAVKLHARAGLPYLYLAHRRFENDNFTEVLSLLDTALTLEISPSFQARCWELKAITQHQLDINPKRVRQSFERAIAFDPFNERIKQNYDVFEASLAGQDERFTTAPIDNHAGFDPVTLSRGAAVADIEFAPMGQAA